MGVCFSQALTYKACRIMQSSQANILSKSQTWELAVLKRTIL